MALTRIRQRLDNFIANWDGHGEFTINNVAQVVPWKGSRKHLSRFVSSHPLIKSLGTIREGGQRVTLYRKVDSSGKSGKIYGRE